MSGQRGTSWPCFCKGGVPMMRTWTTRVKVDLSAQRYGTGRAEGSQDEATKDDAAMSRGDRHRRTERRKRPFRCVDRVRQSLRRRYTDDSHRLRSVATIARYTRSLHRIGTMAIVAAWTRPAHPAATTGWSRGTLSATATRRLAAVECSTGRVMLRGSTRASPGRRHARHGARGDSEPNRQSQ